jgi:hypothetical protein
MMTMTEINHEAEERMAASHGHELGCFEWIAEEICEDATAAGITYECGDFTEVIGRMTVLEQIIERMATGKAECRCPSQDDEE